MNINKNDNISTFSSAPHTLVLTEKLSVAESISALLNANQRKLSARRGDGFFIGNGYILTWCLGHLVELASADVYNEKYAKWLYADLPIIPFDWKYAVIKNKGKQLKIISDLMKRDDVDTVICATDAGREGELIFRLVYEHCKCNKPIKRLWISSMEENAVTDGFRNLKDGVDYETLYKSALCRSQADWIIGINATRLFSVLYNDTLNVGRVQSPTLVMIVEREKAISAFVKEPFYTVDLDCGQFTVSSDKLKDKQSAEDIYTECNGKTAYIKAIEKHEKSSAPPKLYDLTTLQREANHMHGFTSQQTLDYAQSLYEKKLITYPRTDSRYLTEDMTAGLAELVDSVSVTLPFIKNIKGNINVHHVIDNKKVTDHHAIIPTQTMTEANMNQLMSSEKVILHMIAVRLICAVSDKHTYYETTVTVDCEGHLFRATGKTIINGGWKDLSEAYKSTLKDKNDDDNDLGTSLPELQQGQSFEDVRSSLHEGFTSPPKHFTEDTLLSAMECAGDFSEIPDAERKGLGTPATRASIIEKLIKSGFIERKDSKKVKTLIPTEKGVNLITVLPEIIKSPSLTAEWESKLKQIEHGQLSDVSFMSGIAKLTNSLVKGNPTANPEYRSMFNSAGDTVGICPRCSNNVTEKDKGYFCENKSCEFALWKNSKFFISKKKRLTTDIAIALLKDGRVYMNGLYSEKSNKTYNAVIILDDTGDKWVNFKIEFMQKKAGKMHDAKH